MSELVVRDLQRSFGGVQAVGGVSFTLRSGDLLALIGPNGAGKSTCFNLLNGQLRPDSGSVRLDGTELVGLPPRRIWALGVGRTFQITATFASMTVAENVQMVLLSRARRLFGLWRPAAASSANRRWRCWTASAWRHRPTGPAACWPMATSSGSNWRWRWRASRPCC